MLVYLFCVANRTSFVVCDLPAFKEYPSVPVILQYHNVLGVIINATGTGEKNSELILGS